MNAILRDALRSLIVVVAMFGALLGNNPAAWAALVITTMWLLQ